MALARAGETQRVARSRRYLGLTTYMFAELVAADELLEPPMFGQFPLLCAPSLLSDGAVPGVVDGVGELDWAEA